MSSYQRTVVGKTVIVATGGLLLCCSHRKRRIATMCQEQAPAKKDTYTAKDTPSSSSLYDEVPNFTRYGNNSLLRKYLTPQLYRELSTVQTSQGVRLEDIIRAGVSLPYGANPPRGVAGIYVGDAESYRVFAPLLTPIIEEFHNTLTRRKGLQRHRTNLNPQQLIQNRLDPSGEYILSTRMRLARSIQGFRFASCITRGERREIQNIVKACVDTWSQGKYISIMEMSNTQHEDLLQKRIVFQDPDDFALSAGTHRDWPDGRGVYCDDWEDSPGLIIWCNDEDHLWIISSAKSGNVQDVFTRLSEGARALESSMDSLGYRFIEDKTLGFLNSSPSNIGTGFRASVYMKLPLLGKQRGFYKLMTRLHLYAQSDYERQDRRYTGIFDVANLEALGKSEVELINTMIRGVAVLINLERRLEQGEKLDLTKLTHADLMV